MIPTTDFSTWGVNSQTSPIEVILKKSRIEKEYSKISMHEERINIDCISCSVTSIFIAKSKYFNALWTYAPEGFASSMFIPNSWSKSSYSSVLISGI